MFFQFQEKKNIGFYKLFYKVFFHFYSILLPAFSPLFPTFAPWFPPFPPWFPAFLAFPTFQPTFSGFPPWFLTFPPWLPAFPPWFPTFPSFPSFHSLIPHSGFYRYPLFYQKRTRYYLTVVILVSKWANYFIKQDCVGSRGVFRTQSDICDGAFLRKEKLTLSR